MGLLECPLSQQPLNAIADRPACTFDELVKMSPVGLANWFCTADSMRGPGRTYQKAHVPRIYGTGVIGWENLHVEIVYERCI